MPAADPGSASARPPSSRVLLDAAKHLLAESAPSALTGQAIANRAGVNYGLIHRHFGSKSGLLRQALEELTVSLIEESFDADGLLLPIPTEARSDAWRAITYVTMDKASFAEYQSRSPVVETYLAGLRQNRPELNLLQARAATAVGITITHGMAMHRRFLCRAASMPQDDPAIDATVAKWLMGLNRGHGPLGQVIDPEVWGAESALVQIDGASQPARGRAKAEAQLVQAGANLLSDRASSAVTGRELADAAGVNYGLIHHYFGGKEEVLRQSFQLQRDQFFEATVAGPTRPRFFLAVDHPGYVRMITRMSMDQDLTSQGSRFPIADTMIERWVTPQLDPVARDAARVAVIVVVAALLAWSLDIDALRQGLGVDPAELEPVAGPLLRSLLSDPLS